MTGTQQPAGASLSQPSGGLPESIGWNITATMLSGLLGFGLPFWFLARWLTAQWLLGLGLMLGMTAALTIIWFRYGRAHSYSAPASRKFSQSISGYSEDPQ